MSPQEVTTALRSITSKHFRRGQQFPMTVLAQLSGLSRQTLYEVRLGERLTPRVVEVLAPILKAIAAGELTAKRYVWQVNVTKAGMEERQFSLRGGGSLDVGRSVPGRERLLP